MSAEQPARERAASAGRDRRRTRPWSVTITSVGVFILAVYYLTRLVAVLRGWEFYSEVLIPYANVYLLVSGIIGSAAGLGLAAGLWTGRGWARRAVQLGGPLYIVYEWIERLVFDRVNVQAANWPFLLVAGAIVIVWLVWNYSRQTIRQFFGEENEQ